MKRGEVWWVSFDRSIGGEIKKKRPAVIVSNDAANTFLNRVQVNANLGEGDAPVARPQASGSSSP